MVRVNVLILKSIFILPNIDLVFTCNLMRSIILLWNSSKFFDFAVCDDVTHLTHIGNVEQILGETRHEEFFLGMGIDIQHSKILNHYVNEFPILIVLIENWKSRAIFISQSFDLKRLLGMYVRIVAFDLRTLLSSII